MNSSWNDSASTETPSLEDEFRKHEWLYQLLGSYLTFVGLTAFIGNGLMLFVFIKKRMVRQTINILILNVIVADILHAVLGIPMAAISTFRKKWTFEEWGCSMYGFICYVSILSNMCTCVAISMYRYAVMCRPSFAKYLRQRKKVRAIIASIWIYASFWAAMPFLSWGSYTVEPFGTTCSIDWHGHTKGAVSYIICVVIFILFLPLTVMIYWYVKILVTTHVRVSHGITQTKAQITDSRHGVSYMPDIGKRATKIILVTIVVYVIAWIPYGLIFLASAAGGYIPLGLSLVPTAIATAQSAYNPIIYAIGHMKFKVSLMEILTARPPIVVPLPLSKPDTAAEGEQPPITVCVMEKDVAEVATEKAIYIADGICVETAIKPTQETQLGHICETSDA